MDIQEIRYALYLISLFVQASEERRRIEETCGWPSDYGKDGKVLEAAKLFLARPHIAAQIEIIKKALEESGDA